MVDIKPYDRNAKIHPDSQLKQLADIVKFVGWRQPIMVNQQGVIVVGHGRWFTWKKYGQEYGLKPVWIQDDMGKTIHGEPETTPLTPDQEKIYRLADNKLNESDWDMPLIKIELADFDDAKIILTGFSPDILLSSKKDDDDVPEVKDEPVSKLGEIYQLGSHRLMCGDSTNLENVAKLMGGGKADMVFTDPPYNVNYSGRGKETSNTILNDKMSPEEFQQFLDKTFEAYRSAVKVSCPFYVCHSSSSQIAFENSMKKVELKVKNQIIWNKTIASMGWGDYRWKHEPIFYATVGGKETQFYGDRSEYTVWNESWDIHKMEKYLKSIAEKQEKGGSTIWTMKRDSNYKHPTQKPVELILIALQNSSKAEDVVLDLFGGSGSTLVACEKAKRSCYTMELDPRYVDVIIKRWEDYTGNQAVKL